MSRRSFVTNITPLPASISRDAAVAHLHDHHAMIELNPLVLRHEITDPPSNAAPDEARDAIWYEITDQINYLPGGAVKGEVVYKACFYNLPRGLQTHVFAPGGVDIKSKWSVGGSMPGEPREPAELGVNVPRDGLYIKEEVDLRCNVLMSNFVKRNLKKSHLVVADKIVERAEQLSGQSLKKKSLWERPTSRTVERDAGFETEQFSRAASSSSNAGPSWPQQPEIHYSYPPHCACEGTMHQPSCSFFHPDDVTQEDVFRRVQQNKPKPYYAISLPSDSSYSQQSSTAASPDVDDRYPRELVGSPARDRCLCTGGLHEEGCPAYPGLRTPAFPSPLTMPNSPATSIQQSPAAFYGFPSLSPDAAVRNGRPSDVPELAGHSRSAEESPLDRDMMPAPLRSSQAGGSRQNVRPVELG
ncbi:hypothetical protein PRZ48_005082 [Zasmidium cellare]|uniref:DUF7053 domain-containing protein n=1 Tax=Zasmidium cellare TaxID=395010 RepID=A0ABR0ERE2_ZASCE|nr:hypothetical protein PRZ48_005082 [Zasmidium cellare]